MNWGEPTTDAFQLAAACKVGRILAGLDPGVPRWPLPAVLSQPVGTLEQIKLQAVEAALKKHNGVVLFAAAELNISRHTVYDILKRAGRKNPQQPSNVVRLVASLVLVAMLVCGCVSDGSYSQVEAQADRPVVEQNDHPVMLVLPDRSAQVIGRESQVVGEATTATISLNEVTLEWNAEDDAARMAFRVYRNGIDATYTTNWYARSVTLTDVPPGTNDFFVTAVGWDGTESEPSNTVTWLVPLVERLAFAPYIFRAEWAGSDGVLQGSTNLVQWVDLQPLPSGSVVLITNTGAWEFFRVKLD
jgi:hypothetical protein